MDTSSMVLYIIVAFFTILLFINLVKVFMNIFSREESMSMKKENPLEEENPFRSEVRADIEEQVRPHLTSLEGMYEKSTSTASTLGAFVFSVFKDKFSSHIEKDEKLVEEEICKCCSEYEGAECKESFCLESSGLSCPN